MGLVNTVVPLERLEEETLAWCRRMLQLSPLALRMLKASFNADDDGLAGIQQLADDATLLFYMSEEAQEGRDAYVEKRRPDFAHSPDARENRWVAGARPRTLPAAVVPVLVGTAWRRATTVSWRGGPRALVVALAIQVGTNYANDYCDGVRGTDDVRVGPVRLVAAGLGAAGRGEAGGVRRPSRSPARRAGAGGRGELVAAAGRRRVLRRRLALHRRAPALRLRRARRGVRVRVLRPGRHRRLRLRAGGAADGRRWCWPASRSGCWPPPCSS